MPELTTLLPMLAMLLLAGAFAGLMAGLLGVGGGIILVPAYYYIFSTLGHGGDQLMQVCLATSLATIIITSMRSVSSHHKKGAVDWAILRSFAPGIVAGAIAGVFVAALLRSTQLQAIFGVLGITVGFYLAFGRASWRLGDRMPTGARSAGISSFIGFLSVLMGIGGGSFAVPTMSLFSVPIHRAVATAAGFGVLIAVPSVAGFLLVEIPDHSRPPFSIGAVNIPAFIVTISMTLITAPYGAKLAHKLNAKILKRIFAVFLITIASNMLRKALGY